MRLKKYFEINTMILVVAAVSGCASLSPERAAQAVRLLQATEVSACARAGSTLVSVQDRLAALQQIEGGVQSELEALARRSAVQLGGNAIVAIGKVDRGSQSFAVYRCPERRAATR